MSDIDERVAREVMGWEKVNGFKRDHRWVDKAKDPDTFFTLTDWQPSTNIAHAWEVVEKLAEQNIVVSLMDQLGYDEDAGNHNLWRVQFMDAEAHEAERSHEEIWFELCEAEAASMAICKAALKAKGE